MDNEIIHFEGFFAYTEFMMHVMDLLGCPLPVSVFNGPQAQKHIESAVRPVTICLLLLLFSDPNGGGEKIETVEEF